MTICPVQTLAAVKRSFTAWVTSHAPRSEWLPTTNTLFPLPTSEVNEKAIVSLRGLEAWSAETTRSRTQSRRNGMGAAILAFLGALIDRNHFFPNRLADILAERTEKTVILELFENVSAPS